MADEPHKKLTVHDVAFGIGRKATDAELKEWLESDHGGRKDAETVRKNIKQNIKDRKNKRKAS